jgi:hypothetical protein
MKWLALVALLGCSDRAPEYSGVGQWRFGSSTLADAKRGKCQPTDLSDGRKATWCFANPPYLLGANNNASVDLYFLGSEPTAPLIEIQLQVRGCDDAALDRWFTASFGPAIERRTARAYWKNSFMWIAAQMPSQPGRCLVHMLPLSEQAEIARIKQL